MSNSSAEFTPVSGIRAGMDICAMANNVPFTKRLVPETINTTFPGTVPLRLHATVFVPNSGQAPVCNANRMNMTGNSLIWTPQLFNNSVSATEGTTSNLTVYMQPGGSIVWIATEVGDTGNETAYIGGNYTVMTQEMLDHANMDEEKGNGDTSIKPISLKAIVVAALLGMGVLAW